LSQLASTHAHETLLWASKGKGARYTFNYHLINSSDPASQISSVWRIPAVPGTEKSHGRHPTQKPLRLLLRAIVASTAEGDLVFDPFCGSGTTGVAAKELERFFVGADTERGYAELAGGRIDATERGSRWGRSGRSAARTSKPRAGPILGDGFAYRNCWWLSSCLRLC